MCRFIGNIGKTILRYALGNMNKQNYIMKLDISEKRRRHKYLTGS